VKAKFTSLIFQIKHPALSSFPYHLSINYRFSIHTRVAQVYGGLEGKLGYSPQSLPYQVRSCLFSYYMLRAQRVAEILPSPTVHVRVIWLPGPDNVIEHKCNLGTRAW